jgi:predicted O-linked N-acetylglucosamine transferase (SPINDLY family)
VCRFAAARTDHLKALSLRPDAPRLRSPYLYALNYMPDVNARTITLEHKTWGERHGRPGGAYTAWDVDPDLKRTLRVGLVSADFGRHPVGYLLTGVLEALDPRQLAVVGYSGRAKEDEVTARLRAGTTAWRRTIGLGDRKLAEAIRADRIDILIDLAGHTEGNRLTCFALRPAPVQATWIGYCGTTGVPAIDYILMDKVHVPRGSERWFTERVVRLPGGHWCYSPPADAPEVVPPPCLDAGHVTFGSFNSPIKINDDVLAVWAEVLAVVPKARLLLCWPSYQDPLQRGRILDELRHCGVDPGQVELIPGLPHKALLEAYGRIDVALDTFPFSGGITSCEALWMGVPLVTWPENRPVSRQTLGQLRAIGRTEWVAGDAEDYIRKAVELAGDPARLAALRREQRSRMAASRLCDARAFAGELQTALRTIWRDWCRNAAPAATRVPPSHRDGAGDEPA